MKIEVGDQLLAVDPGLTTGIVVGEYKGGYDFDIIYAADVKWDRRFVFRELVPAKAIRHIIYERFALYESKARDQINNTFPSVRVIGILEAYCNECDKLDWMVEQPAAVHTKVKITDAHTDRLKLLHHARSAYKHLRYYIITEVRKYTPKTEYDPGAH